MGDEHLSTIPETESDELIKSSVEILVPIPSLEEVNDDHEEKEFDLEDILQIQDVILRRNCTDNAKITRKRSKSGKHEHENGKSAQEPEVSSIRSSKVNP
ncbi:hypothetical protein Tco_1146694 [Tanacetum coccineum]